jgi:hypothetical protein
MSHEIISSCAQLQIGEPVHTARLTMFPLFFSDAQAMDQPSYRVLRDAMTDGTGRVTEISAAGSVPVLRFTNEGSQPVLMLDGEELVGCKQNRILNLSILAPSGEAIQIPVSCVEMGRWSSKSAHFSHSERTMYMEIRARKVAQVTRSMRETGDPHADQGDIWASISEKSRRMGSRSATQAMSGVFEERKDEIDRIRQAFAPLPNQVGAVFAIRGRLAGVEWFDMPGTLSKYMPAIVSGYALDAIDDPAEELLSPAAPEPSGGAAEESTSQPPSMEAVRALLARIAASAPERRPGVGIGEDLRIDGDGLVGAVLVEAGRVVHLCAFADTVLATRARKFGRR